MFKFIWVRHIRRGRVLSPTTQKISLSLPLPPPPPPQCPPHCFAPKNVDFVIFTQFLAILPKLSPLQVDLLLSIQTTLFWGHFGPFLAKFGQKGIFLEKRALSVLKYSNYLPSCKKSEKKLMTHSWDKCQTDKATDRQTDKGDFIGLLVERGYNKQVGTSNNWRNNIAKTSKMGKSVRHALFIFLFLLNK